jgi:hypothetical protein
MSKVLQHVSETGEVYEHQLISLRQKKSKIRIEEGYASRQV